eukprot:scaffold206864_cov51-Attheya_sp.AAC.2
MAVGLSRKEKDEFGVVPPMTGRGIMTFRDEIGAIACISGEFNAIVAGCALEPTGPRLRSGSKLSVGAAGAFAAGAASVVSLPPPPFINPNPDPLAGGGAVF